MNKMISFTNQQSPQRMAQALENYVLPEQKFQMPQTPSAGGVSPMDVVKMMGKKKPMGTNADAKDAYTPTDLNVYQESQ